MFSITVKEKIKNNFKFLEGLGFEITQSKNLVYKDWPKDGVIYSNGQKVVAVLCDNREKLLSTIVYSIPEDLQHFKIEEAELVILSNYLDKNCPEKVSMKVADINLYGTKNVISNAANELFELRESLL